MDKKGIAPEEAFPTIQDWLDNCDYIVGHNVLGFDIYLIKDLYENMVLIGSILQASLLTLIVLPEASKSAQNTAKETI